MPKMKTRRALAKRVKKTGSGKWKRNRAYTSHFFSHKSQKQKRHLRKSSLVHGTDLKRIKLMIVD